MEFPYPYKTGSSKVLRQYEELCYVEWSLASANQCGFNTDAVLFCAAEKMDISVQDEAEYEVLKFYAAKAKAKFVAEWNQARNNGGKYQIVEVEPLIEPKLFLLDKPEKKGHSRKETAKWRKENRKLTWNYQEVVTVQNNLFE